MGRAGNRCVYEFYDCSGGNCIKRPQIQTNTNERVCNHLKSFTKNFFEIQKLKKIALQRCKLCFWRKLLNEFRKIELKSPPEDFHLDRENWPLAVRKSGNFPRRQSRGEIPQRGPSTGGANGPINSAIKRGEFATPGFN